MGKNDLHLSCSSPCRQIVAKLETLLFFQFYDGAHRQKDSVREHAKRVVRACFGETIVVTNHGERRLHSMFRENKPHCLDDVNVAQIILAEASH